MRDGQTDSGQAGVKGRGMMLCEHILGRKCEAMLMQIGSVCRPSAIGFAPSAFRLRPPRSLAAALVMASADQPAPSIPPSPHGMKLLFVEMGTGYDQHGQNITTAAMRACKNAISSNSIPAFRTGALPGVSYQKMKLKLKLGVPHSVQHELDLEQVKSVFPYGEIVDVAVVDGGLICSSGVALEAMGDKNDDCYVVNAAIYVGY